MGSLSGRRPGLCRPKPRDAFNLRTRLPPSPFKDTEPGRFPGNQSQQGERHENSKNNKVAVGNDTLHRID